MRLSSWEWRWGGGRRSWWHYQVKDDGIVLVKVEVGWWVDGRRSWWPYLLQVKGDGFVGVGVLVILPSAGERRQACPCAGWVGVGTGDLVALPSAGERRRACPCRARWRSWWSEWGGCGTWGTATWGPGAAQPLSWSPAAWTPSGQDRQQVQWAACYKTFRQCPLDTIWPRQAAGTVGSLLQDLQTMPTGHHLAKTGSRYSGQLATRPSDNAHWTPSGQDRQQVVGSLLQDLQTMPIGHHLAKTGSRYSGQLATRPSDNAHWTPSGQDWQQVQWAACYKTFRQCPLDTIWPRLAAGTVGSLLQDLQTMPIGHHLA